MTARGSNNNMGSAQAGVPGWSYGTSHSQFPSYPHGYGSHGYTQASDGYEDQAYSPGYGPPDGSQGGGNPAPHPPPINSPKTKSKSSRSGCSSEQGGGHAGPHPPKDGGRGGK